MLDAYAEKGVRVHVTETGVSHRGKIVGPVLTGEWTEELQAEYLRRYLSVLYSHPNVDVVNFWGFGPVTWQPDIGLLDEAYEPLPAFHALRELVNETWRTRLTQRADRNGAIHISGGSGGYRVSVRDPLGRSGSASLHLSRETEEGAALDIRISLEP